MEVIQACFSGLKVLKLSFHNCRGGAIPVGACLSAGNIRESRIYCHWCPKVVVQSCLKAMKVHKFNFTTIQVMRYPWTHVKELGISDEAALAAIQVLLRLYRPVSQL